jgi:serine O-acetyltransferase
VTGRHPHYDLVVPSESYPFSRAMSDLRADLRRYRRLSGRPTLVNLWLSPGTIASIHYRVAHWAWSASSPWHLLMRVPLLLAQRLVEVWSGVGISPQAVIGPGLYIGHFGQVIINGDATIGANASLSQEITIGYAQRGPRAGVPTIGDRVYIAPGAKLFGAITIGDDVAVGANAVVNRDIEDRGVVGGVPARLISKQGSFDMVFYVGMEGDPARSASLALADRPSSGEPGTSLPR